MLEEVLANTKLWNANIFGIGMRVSASNRLNPGWLEGRIEALSQHDNVSYDRLTHPEQKSADGYKNIAQKAGMDIKPFEVPILRLTGKQPKKKVLLQAIHAYEWAAIEAIMRFVDDWGKGEVLPEIREKYEITVIPLLSIDKFPRHYGSANSDSDVRFETIKQELDSADMVIELHESSIKNQYMTSMGVVYGLYGLALAGSYLRFGRDNRQKARNKVQSEMVDFRKYFNSDIEIRYSNDRDLIKIITSDLDKLKVEANEGSMAYSRRMTTKNEKPTYGIELHSDWGEIGEGLLLLCTGMTAYPLTEISTYFNRTFRRGQIKRSRLQSAKNGVRVVQSILTANL